MSVDSMQVYRGMDIGTAKPPLATRQQIVHHMVDVADPDEEFSAAEFQQLGREAIRQAEKDGGRIIIAGGSGMHFRSVVDPLSFAPTDPEIREELEEMSLDGLQGLLFTIDPDAARTVDVQNPRRVIRAIEIWRITSVTPSERWASVEAEAVRSYEPYVPHSSIGVDAGERSSARVRARLDGMVREGLLEEVRSLAPNLGRTASQALGYKQLLDVDNGSEMSSALDRIRQATDRLVKRQRTYFGRDPRIGWIPWQDDEDERVAAGVRRVGEVSGWNS